MIARALIMVASAWVCLCLLVVAAEAAGLVLVTTPSIPMGVYLRKSSRKENPARGDYVCLWGRGPRAPAVLRSMIRDGVADDAWKHFVAMKRVAGLAGDRVEYVRGHVVVNGVALSRSAILEADSHGQRLARATLPVVLGADELWLASEHERGLDSRYYGPVKASAISCRAEGVWTF